MKEDLIDKLYDDKHNYIEENLDDFIDSLTKSQKNALYRWMDTDDDHEYTREIKNDIKLLLYNKRTSIYLIRCDILFIKKRFYGLHIQIRHKCKY
jgi:hypothetical protein